MLVVFWQRFAILPRTTLEWTLICNNPIVASFHTNIYSNIEIKEAVLDTSDAGCVFKIANLQHNYDVAVNV